MTPAGRKIRVLFVEDDVDFRAPVEAYLRRNGMEVQAVGSAEGLAELFAAFKPEILILDVNLPGKSGLEVIADYRNRSALRIVMLTAMGDSEHRLKGIEEGADHYLTKPVKLRELVGILRNLHGRIEQAHPDAGAEVWTYDEDKFLLISPDGVEVALSTQTNAVVSALLRKSGQEVDRDFLRQVLGKHTENPEDRSVDLVVSRLRQRCKGSAFPLPIKAVRSIGYIVPNGAVTII